MADIRFHGLFSLNKRILVCCLMLTTWKFCWNKIEEKKSFTLTDLNCFELKLIIYCFKSETCILLWEKTFWVKGLKAIFKETSSPRFINRQFLSHYFLIFGVKITKYDLRFKNKCVDMQCRLQQCVLFRQFMRQITVWFCCCWKSYQFWYIHWMQFLATQQHWLKQWIHILY